MIGESAEIKADAFGLEKLADASYPINNGNAEALDAVVSGYTSLLLEDMDSGWCHTARAAYHDYFASAAGRLIAFYEDTAYEAAQPLK